MRRTLSLLLFSAGAFLSVATAFADPTEGTPMQGQAKSLQCVACHGRDGISGNPEMPNLAGQNALYIARQLQHFKSGRRYEPRMTPVAQSLSDQDIRALAFYFSRLTASRKNR